MKILKQLFLQQGLTFIEAMAALGILIIGVIAGLTLAAYNLNVSVAAEGRLLAANFAREGIEVIRQIRDSNWLSGAGWSENILEDAENHYRLITKFDPAANQWVTQDVTDDIDSCTVCQIYYDSSTGVYNHDPLKEKTDYRRLIRVNHICWVNGLDQEVILGIGAVCSGNQELIGYQLTAQVTWRDNNQDHSLEAVDRIYNWR